MNEEIIRHCADLCLILESSVPDEMFSGEIVAEMFNQIISGHSAVVVAEKHGIRLP